MTKEEFIKQCKNAYESGYSDGFKGGMKYFFECLCELFQNTKDFSPIAEANKNIENNGGTES